MLKKYNIILDDEMTVLDFMSKDAIKNVIS
jgi:hypothetical protein